jgi:phosphoribosylpyrophosphate synthetase
MLAVIEPKLISGNPNLPLAKSIAGRISMHGGMGVNLVEARVERFNDQEIFVEVFENVRREDMYVIQSTSNPANDNLMQPSIMTDALRRPSAACIAAIIPYFDYARHARRAKARTPISAKLVANLIETAGIDRVPSGPAVERVENSVMKSLVITDSTAPTDQVKVAKNIRIVPTVPTSAQQLLNIWDRMSVSSLLETDTLVSIYEGPLSQSANQTQIHASSGC